MNTAKNIAEALLDYEAVKISLDPLFTWTSGIKSPVYCDMRSITSNVDLRRRIINVFIDILEGDDVDVIAGTSTAGISWAAWLAEALNKPMVYVRKRAKGHGTKKRVEGRMDKAQSVVLIEDLISMGGSSAASVRALQEDCDANVVKVLAINTYGMKEADKIFKEFDVPLQTVTSFSTIIDVAVQRGDINKEQAYILREFSMDPTRWAQKLSLLN